VSGKYVEQCCHYPNFCRKLEGQSQQVLAIVSYSKITKEGSAKVKNYSPLEGEGIKKTQI